MGKARLYAGMAADEAKKVSMLRTYYRKKGIDLDPQRLRFVAQVRDHVKNVLSTLRPDERQLVIGSITPKVKRRRKRAK